MGLLLLALPEPALVLIEAVLEHFRKLAGNSCDLPDHFGKVYSGHHHLHSLIATTVS